jgi:hypothetical protein
LRRRSVQHRLPNQVTAKRKSQAATKLRLAIGIKSVTQVADANG